MNAGKQVSFQILYTTDRQRSTVRDYMGLGYSFLARLYSTTLTTFPKNLAFNNI